ncbi:MAG: hypothetical protein MjAS7_2403 [Metallosphaera javensis (ex Sakai et al. 2022)]|nr:MAG: hypothetical protein MjAS7_2403 [Metallosphaera javensis (ex Sakai et al. 2022)]
MHDLSTKMAQGRISNVFVFPFKEELFQFSGTSEYLPRFSQIETLAKMHSKTCLTTDFKIATGGYTSQ